MRNCDGDHVVGQTDAGYDVGVYLERASDVLEDWWPDKPDDQFRFCPRCGASLDDFWRAVDEKIIWREQNP